MNNDDIALMEMPEHDSISLCVFIENEDLLQLGDRINAKYEQAYMNGYNWDALITHYVKKRNPDLANLVTSDPEAGMYSAFMAFSDDNLAKMKMFESYVRELLSDEQKLMEFISENESEIEWD